MMCVWVVMFVSFQNECVPLAEVQYTLLCFVKSVCRCSLSYMFDERSHRRDWFS